MLRTRSAVVLHSAAVLAASVTGSASSAAADPPRLTTAPGDAVPGKRADRAYSVTLITGDRVDLTIRADGKSTGEVQSSLEPVGGTATVRIPGGAYALSSDLFTQQGDVPDHRTASITLVTAPRFVVDRNLTITLDARTGGR